SSAAAKARTTLALRVAVDLAPMDDVRSGRPDLTPIAVGITETGELHWSGGGVDVVLIAPGAQVTIEDPEHPVLTWDVEAGPGRPAEVSYRLSASDRDAPVVPSLTAPLSVPEVSGGDDRLRALLQQSVNDLTGLVMATAETPDQPFVAAGAPWFLT